jgi:hypothetical protein
MNAELIEDLKQFIDSRFSQQEARFDEKLDLKLDSLENKLLGEISELRTEMHEGFAGVGDAMDDMYKHLDERLTALEERAA